MKAFILSFLILLVSCKFVSGSEVERAKHHDDVKAGETWTEARIRSLNKYASDLLNGTDSDDVSKQAQASLKSAEKRLGSIYKIEIPPGNTCFFDGGWLEDENDLYWSKAKNQMKIQIESAAEFIKNFYVDLKGNSQHLLAFDKVEICTGQDFAQRITLNNRVLKLFVKASGHDSYKTYSQYAIRAMWDAGEHNAIPSVGTTSEKSKYVQLASNILWQIFNPVGKFKETLDSLLAQHREDTQAKINEHKKPQPNLKNRVANLVKSVNGFVKVDALDNPAQKSIEAIASLGKFDVFLNNWSCLVKNPRIADRLGKGSMAVVQKSLENEINKINIKITSTHGAAYGNYHRVAVAFAADAGPFEKYIAKPVITNRENSYNIEVTGKWFAGFTIDDITVDVAVKIMTASLQKSLSSASFEEAVEATKRGEKLTCN